MPPICKMTVDLPSSWWWWRITCVMTSQGISLIITSAIYSVMWGLSPRYGGSISRPHLMMANDRMWGEINTLNSLAIFTPHRTNLEYFFFWIFFCNNNGIIHHNQDVLSLHLSIEICRPRPYIIKSGQFVFTFFRWEMSTRVTLRVLNSESP